MKWEDFGFESPTFTETIRSWETNKRHYVLHTYKLETMEYIAVRAAIGTALFVILSREELQGYEKGIIQQMKEELMRKCNIR